MPALCIAVAVAATLVMGCAAPGALRPGTPIGQARHLLVAPTAEYPLPGGGTRLEFAQGAFGRQTFMLDFDADGALVASTQVLTEANFSTITPGLSGAEVRLRLGRPVQVFAVPWQKLHVWNYRYFDGNCAWFQVSISDAAQQVTEAGLGSDPACDGPNSRD